MTKLVAKFPSTIVLPPPWFSRPAPLWPPKMAKISTLYPKLSPLLPKVLTFSVVQKFLAKFLVSLLPPVAIGAEYNMSKDSTFSVSDFSKTISYAVAETEISGGTSRAVNAVSKVDQDKLLAQATEKIKQITSNQVAADSPGRKSIPSSDLQFTKKFSIKISAMKPTLFL